MASWRLPLLLLLSTLLCCTARPTNDCLIYRTAGFGWGSNIFGVRAPPAVLLICGLS